jgi:glycosyltransferase involved in cell wall biosynthesis
MVRHNIQLSIGILAHNERLNIEKTLNSLFGQDVFQKFTPEIVVVANDCTDETASLAARSLADHREIWSHRGSARVEELAVAGKANAWNQFVHKFSSPLASILILMDADIVFLNTSTISSMIRTLESTPEAVVCVDRPIKDIELNIKRTFIQKLLVAATPPIEPDNVPLCGQLYCVRSVSVRQIHLPVQIAGEDGFLRALLLTEGFTKPPNAGRIILDSTAAHSFASVASLREVFKHEKWIVSSSIVSMLLYERFWKECNIDRSAMKLMEDWQEKDPDWLPRYIQLQVQERGWRLLPRHWWTRRWSRLRRLPFRRRLQWLPVAAIATAMDMLVFIAAIRDVRGGRAFRYWGRK